ncbi:MAG: Sulfite oxidase and related enzymes, partial [uncultured Thermomicrobiales bacterium]
GLPPPCHQASDDRARAGGATAARSGADPALAGLAPRRDSAVRPNHVGPARLRPRHGTAAPRLGRVSGAPAGHRHRRHALRDALEQARQPLAGGRGARDPGARRCPTGCALRPLPRRRRLHREPAARRPRRQRRDPRHRPRRRAPHPGARRPAAGGHPQALRMEGREVAARHRAPGRGPPRLLGGVRLLRHRRPLAGGALRRL